MVTDLKKYSFPKQERIVSQKLIDELFTGGQSHSLTAFPLRAVYSVCSVSTKVQLLLSVPKRRFKHAVDRNRVKRQVREAFRRHKDVLYPSVPDNQRLFLAFIWLADEHFPTAEVEKRVVRLMQRIAER